MFKNKKYKKIYVAWNIIRKADIKFSNIILKLGKGEQMYIYNNEYLYNKRTKALLEIVTIELQTEKNWCQVDIRLYRELNLISD